MPGKPQMKPEVRQRIAYRVAQLFLEFREQSRNAAKDKNINLTEYIRDRIRLEYPDVSFTREKVYDAVDWALQLGYFILVPPFEVKLQDALEEKYPHLANHMHVVHTANHLDSRKVSIAAADIALKRAHALAKRLGGQPLGLGLGPGRASRDFCESFGHLYPKDNSLPKLNLYAITAGGSARESENTSISFFNFLDDGIVNSRLGLFAENLVPHRRIKDVLKSAGVKDAYAERDRIHMIITSMGDMCDQDDLLRIFLEDSGRDVDRLVDEEGWIGNVQYRPYTAKGPVREKGDELRAVTLFELDDLANRVGRDDRSVILIARQCGKCKRTRAKALEPLLEVNSGLRVFSDLIMDAATCLELLNGQPDA